jgi:hypothetical protein
VSQNGLGISTAKAFALHHPALLILAARSQAALDAAVSTIKEAVPDCPTRVLNLDLGSFRTVRAAAAEVNSWDDVPKIDIMINNAATAAEMSWKLSEDGIEHHFATNHIGPFLFTNLIVDKVIAAKGRVVNVSSVGHVSSSIRFDDSNFKVSKSLSGEVLQIEVRLTDAMDRMERNTMLKSHMASPRQLISSWPSRSHRSLSPKGSRRTVCIPVLFGLTPMLESLAKRCKVWVRQLLSCSRPVAHALAKNTMVRSR